MDALPEAAAVIGIGRNVVPRLHTGESANAGFAAASGTMSSTAAAAVRNTER